MKTTNKKGNAARNKTKRFESSSKVILSRFLLSSNLIWLNTLFDNLFNLIEHDSKCHLRNE